MDLLGLGDVIPPAAAAPENKTHPLSNLESLIMNPSAVASEPKIVDSGVSLDNLLFDPFATAAPKLQVIFINPNYPN